MSDSSSDLSNKYEKLRIHFGYWIFIFIISLIFITTTYWSPKDKFTEYLSNAATMTSLVLGLIAIFYSFVSNDSLSKSLGSINDVSRQVSDSKDQIASYIAQTKVTGEVVSQSSKQIEVASHEVKSNMSSLILALDDIKSQTALIQNAVALIPNRIDSLEANFLVAAKNIGEKTNQGHNGSNTNLDDSLVTIFLQNTSLFGNLLIIACVLANSTRKELLIIKFSELIEQDLALYASAMIDSMDAMEFIDAKWADRATKVVSIEKIHQYLQQNAESYFIEYLDTSFKDKPQTKEKWMGRLKSVQDMFV